MISRLCCKFRSRRVWLILLAAFFQFSAQAQDRQTATGLEESALKLATEWRGESARQAVNLHLRAADEFIKLKDFSSAAQSFRRAARLYDILGERPAALAAAKRAVGFNSNLPPLDAIKNLVIYSRMLASSSDPANLAKALKVAEQAGELAARSDDPAANGYALRSLAEINEVSGEFAGAEANLIKAVEMFRLRNDEKVLANALLNLASVRIATAKYLPGLANVEEALQMFVETGESRNITRSKITRGHLLNMLGRKQEALDEYLDAEKAFPADIDGVEKARLQNGIGFLYQELGELGLSIAKRREALDLYQKWGYVQGVQLTLTAMVDLSFKLGDDQAALEYLKASEKLASRTSYPFGLGISRGFAADHYLAKKNYDLAISYYGSALSSFEDAHMLFPSALIHDKLGSAFAAKNSNVLARRHFERSLSISRQVHSREAETNTLYKLAQLELSEGRIDKALQLSQASIDGTERLSAEVRNSRLRSSHFASIAERYDLQIRVLMMAAETTGDTAYVEKALQAVERSRARSILAKLELLQANVTADAPPEMLDVEKQLLAQYNAATDNLANLIDAGAETAKLDEADRQIRGIEQQIEQLRVRISSESPIYSAMKVPRGLDVNEVQSYANEKNCVVLEYWLGEKQSYLWVIDESGLSAHPLPGRREIEMHVSSLRNLIAENEARPAISAETVEEYQSRTASAESAYLTHARELSQILLGPVSNRLRNKRLIVVADGLLHLLPFSALPLPDADNSTPLLATNEVVYQPSAHALALSAKLPPRSGNDNRRDLLVFSDPVFATDDERLTRATVVASDGKRSGDSFRLVESLDSLTRLAGSDREADSIVQTIGASADRFDGFAATREAFLGSGPGNYRVIHIATHANADTERPDLSGIVFSRYAASGERLNEMVRLQDIYSLKLDCDLVVLSACETGVGKELKGEGLLSLNNAFLQAGSRSVISTLWKVEDEAANMFMTSFYEGMTDEHLTASESFTRAQLLLRQQPRFRSSFYWAAFTLHGNADISPFPIGRRSVAIFVVPVFFAALLAAGVGFVFFRRRKRRSTL